MLRTRETESGFSIIEVVVALMIMAAVGATLAQAVTVSSSAQTTQKVRNKQLAVAEGIFQKLQVNTEWFDPSKGYCPAITLGAPEVTCSNVKALFASDPILQDARLAADLPLAIEISAVGLDSNADGVGLRDEDGTRPDFFRVAVTVSVPGRTSEFKSVTVGGTINPAARGGTGSLVVQVCSVRRQYDLRQTIGGCPQPFEIQLDYPTGSSSSGSADWSAMLDRLSPSAGSEGQQMLTYEVVPVATSITATRREGALNGSLFQPQPGRGCVIISSDTFRCNTSTAISSDPLYPTSSTTVSGLPPGTYDISVSAPVGYELWNHMSVPAGGTAVVESGTRSRTIMMLRPQAVDGYHVNLESCDESDPTDIVCTPKTVIPLAVHMIPSGLGRADESFDPGSSSGYSTASVGDSEIVVNGLAPGLYLPRFSGSSGRFYAAGGNFVWIDPPRDGLGYNVPRDSDPTTRAKFTIMTCENAKRDLVIANVESMYLITIDDTTNWTIPSTFPAPWGGRRVPPCTSPPGVPSAKPQNDGSGGT